MAILNYRDSYFESPEDLEFKLEHDFLQNVADHVRTVLGSSKVDSDYVVGIYGVASLFGLIRVSELMRTIEQNIQGRVVVFFPGKYEDNNFRLLDARDGWNYLAIPITLDDTFAT